MAKKTRKSIFGEKAQASKAVRLPTHVVIAPTVALDVDYRDVEFHKLNEIFALIWLPENLSEEARNARLVRAIEQYKSLRPADGLEGMLASQMVGTHHAALECLRRAALTGQTFEGRDQALRHAQKLMNLYTLQVAALNKHRGKGQQKVTVEHVTVESGGQAIVGNVERGAGGTTPKLKQIEERHEIPIEPAPPTAEEFLKKK